MPRRNTTLAAPAGGSPSIPPRDSRPTIVGKTIVAVRPMTKEETRHFMWFPGSGDMPMVLVLNDGTLLIPQQDPEGNGPGMLLALGKRTIPTADPTHRAVEEFGDLVWTDGGVGHPSRGR